MSTNNACALANREIARLLLDWGFEPEKAPGRSTGGHAFYRHTMIGRRVAITAPGRKTPTPLVAVRKAAEIVGVTLAEFYAGPVRPRPTVVPPLREEIPMDTPAPALEVVAPEPVESEPVVEPAIIVGGRGHGQPTTKVLHVLYPDGRERFRCSDCNEERDSYGSVVHHKRTHTPPAPTVAEPIAVEPVVEPVVEQLPAPPRPVAPARRLYEETGIDWPDGGVVLRDDAGRLWVARRVVLG